MKKQTSLALVVAAFAPIASSHAAVIFSDDFSGLSTAPLHNTTTDAGSKTWTANALFKADGSYTTTNGADDRGAALDLGPTFFADQFALGNNKIILTVTYGISGNGDSFSFSGFSTDTWIAATTSATASDFQADARAQSQGITVAVEYDTIGTFASGIFQDNTAGDAQIAVRTPLSTTVLQSYTLTIQAGASYANSTVTVTNGVDTTFITGYDASALRTFYIGVEAGTTDPNKTGNFDSVQLEAIPEPSAALLGGLGVLVLLRRRR